MDLVVEEKATVAQPHDKIVKKLFANANIAKDVLMLFLPEALLKILDLNLLELKQETYVNFLFDERRIDFLFKAPAKLYDAYVYFLLEHQSSVDKWMQLRVPQYSCFIWESLKNCDVDGKIPFIYPLVLYNGKNKYSKSVNMRDLIYPEALCEFFDNFFMPSFHLVDLSGVDDKYLIDRIDPHLLGVALLLTLKHIFDDDLEITFETVLCDVYKNLDSKGYRNELLDMLNYLVNEGNYSNIEIFFKRIQQEFSSNLEGNIMGTIAQQLMVKGKNEEKIEIAKKLLDANLDVVFISKITGLNQDVIVKISMQQPLN